jgi:hypothetical protein
MAEMVPTSRTNDKRPCENRPVADQKRDVNEVQQALHQLCVDALEIYERARREVTIQRSDGSTQRYAPVRYMQGIERGHEDPKTVELARARMVEYAKRHPGQ